MGIAGGGNAEMRTMQPIQVQDTQNVGFLPYKVCLRLLLNCAISCVRLATSLRPVLRGEDKYLLYGSRASAGPLLQVHP